MAEQQSGYVVYGRNFRGFREVEIDLRRANFVVGDNSSGKSSLLHLVHLVLGSDLDGVPRMDSELSVSPYDYFSLLLDYAPVTLGMTHYDGEDSFAKFISLEQERADRSPRIRKCTYSTTDRLLTISSHGKVLKSKSTSIAEFPDTSTILEHHESTRGYSLIDRFSDGEVPANHMLAALFGMQKTSGGTTARILNRSIVEDRPGSRHIGPVRHMPERFYTPERMYTASGKYFATMWHDTIGQNASKLKTLANEFGKEAGLFDRLNIEPVKKSVRGSPLKVSIERDGKEFYLNQVGVGVSQVIPVLVELIFEANAKQHAAVLLQQPELHLHPVAQAAFGSFLFKLRDKLPGLIVETHSNYLIDRYRAELRDYSASGQNGAEMLFCQHFKDGNTASKVVISREGKFIDPPYEYFAFFLSELDRTTF